MIFNFIFGLNDLRCCDARDSSFNQSINLKLSKETMERGEGRGERERGQLEGWGNILEIFPRTLVLVIFKSFWLI